MDFRSSLPPTRLLHKAIENGAKYRHLKHSTRGEVRARHVRELSFLHTFKEHDRVYKPHAYSTFVLHLLRALDLTKPV